MLAAGQAADPQSWNRYGYALSDPANLNDPEGLCSPGISFCITHTGHSDPDFYTSTEAANALLYGWISALQFLNQAPSNGGGKATGHTFAAAEATFEKDAAKLSKTKKFSEKCNKDFAALGTSADAVKAGADKATFSNGVGSNIPRSSLYASSPNAGVRQAGNSVTGTVGSFIASNPGTVALAQLGGNNIYLNGALIDSTDYYQDLGIVLHEVLHNVTSLTDQDIQEKLGLKTTPVSDNITQKLVKDCF